MCKFLIIQSGQTKCPTPALSPVTPNHVLGLPWYIVRGYPIQCLHTAPGNVGTMFLHCPGQCGDIVSALPLIWGTMWRHCNRTAPHLGGSVETLYPQCPSSGRQCGDIVPALPLIWGAVQRHCTRTAPGSTETIATGIAEILYGVPPNNVPGQPRDIVRGYLRQCRGSLFCLPRLNWESFIPFTFLFPTE